MSGWTNWPTGISRTDADCTYYTIQMWNWLVEAWYAMRERHAIFGCNTFWPPPDKWDAFSSGTIDSITDNGDGTMSVTMSGFTGWDSGSGCSSPKFAPGYNCGSCLPNIPTNYDLAISTDDQEDPFLTTRGDIQSVSYTAGPPTSGSLVIGSQKILDAITAGYFSSLSSLVGANWYIIKQGSPMPSERLPDKPNDQTIYQSSSSTGTTVTVTGTVYSAIVDTTASLPSLVHSPANQLLAYGSDGALHRENIVGNSPNTIWYNYSSTYTLSGSYLIMANGERGMPGRTLISPYQFYSGIPDNYNSHLTDGKTDSIGTWPLPAYQNPIWQGDVCTSSCTQTSATCLDTDFANDIDMTCAGQDAGKFLSPNFWKTFRAIQGDIVGLCTSYIKYQDYSTFEHNAINNYTPATFFNDLGINSWTTGYSYIDGSHLAISGAPTGVNYPIDCYYTLLNADGSLSAGNGSLTSSTTLQGGSFSNSSPLPTEVYISLGFSRYRERQVKYLYPKSNFIPTNDDGAIDPPQAIDNGDGTFTCDTGFWEKRPKSTCYLTRDIQGQGYDGNIPFVTNDIARLVGDNANMPGILPASDTASPLTPYYDKFWRGTYGTNIQPQIVAGMGGKITGWQSGNGGTNNTIIDGTKNWWVDGVNGSFVETSTGTVASVSTGTSAVVNATIPTTATSCSFVVYNGMGASVLAGNAGVSGGASTATLGGNFTSPMIGDTVSLTFQGFLHVETFTATGGSTTSLTTSYTVSSQPQSCWWNGARFLGFSDPSPYTEFMAVVTQGTNTYKLPITQTQSASTVVISFEPVDGYTASSGDVVSITEPAYEVNKWQTRTVTITDTTTGNIYTSQIKYSDNNSLNISQVYHNGTPTTIAPATDGTWSYAIQQYDYDTILKWDGTNWNEVKSGTDTTRLGVTSPNNFLPVVSGIQRNLPTLYLDYGFQRPDDILTTTFFEEIYNSINALTTTKGSVSWTNTPCDGMPENNYGSSSAEDYTIGTFAASLSEAQSGFSWSSPLDGTAPYSSGGCYYDGAYMVDLEGVYAYEIASGYCQLYPATIDFYAFSPAIDDFCFCSLEITGCPNDPTTGEPPPVVPPSCDNCGGADGMSPCVLVSGSSDWTGGTVADLLFNQWQKLSSSDNSSSTACSRAVGNSAPQLVLDPIATLGYTGLTPGLGAGYSVTDQLAIFNWSFDYHA